MLVAYTITSLIIHNYEPFPTQRRNQSGCNTKWYTALFTLYSCLITCSKPESSGWVLSSITAAGKIIYLMKTHWLKTDTTYICCIVVLLKANKDRACYVITSPLLGHPTCWLERLNLDQKCRAAYLMIPTRVSRAIWIIFSPHLH